MGDVDLSAFNRPSGSDARSLDRMSFLHGIAQRLTRKPFSIIIGTLRLETDQNAWLEQFQRPLLLVVAVLTAPRPVSVTLEVRDPHKGTRPRRRGFNVDVSVENMARGADGLRLEDPFADLTTTQQLEAWFATWLTIQGGYPPLPCHVFRNSSQRML